MTHVSPSRIMIPVRDMISLHVSPGGRGPWDLLILYVFCFWRLRLCLTDMKMMTMKTMVLKQMTRKIGPSKPKKNTHMLLIKQLCRGG